jgi:hypothetical protein
MAEIKNSQFIVKREELTINDQKYKMFLLHKWDFIREKKQIW